MADARVLLQLLRGQSRHGSHAQRLQDFYAPQAERYDGFREHLLHGRCELIDRIDARPGDRVVEMGGGTGRNLLYFGDRLHAFSHIDLVDLCPAMLAQARLRTRNWLNVTIVEGDATRWRPVQQADHVFFSYSLTMIPDWQKAIDNAISILKPGGSLGVVDFYVSPREPMRGRARHGAVTRWFWRRWFGHDGVMLDPTHLAYLTEALPEHALEERRGSVPYLPFLKVPHYVFVGRKSEAHVA